jgi:hypothetical protein
VEYVQDTPTDAFAALQDGDVLFIDSSHTASESAYHVAKIFPTLARGVFVHIHDIYYPYDIHPQWGEQLVVLDHLRTNPTGWSVIVSMPFAVFADQWFYRVEQPLTRGLLTWMVPGSLWLRRV